MIGKYYMCTINDTSEHLFQGCGKIPSIERRMVSTRISQVTTSKGKYYTTHINDAITTLRSIISSAKSRTRDTTLLQFLDFSDKKLADLGSEISIGIGVAISTGLVTMGIYKYWDILSWVYTSISTIIKVIGSTISHPVTLTAGLGITAVVSPEIAKWAVTLAAGYVYQFIVTPAINVVPGTINVSMSALKFTVSATMVGASKTLRYFFDRSRNILDSTKTSTVWDRFDKSLLSLQHNVDDLMTKSMEQITSLSTVAKQTVSTLKSAILGLPITIYYAQFFVKLILTNPVNITNSIIQLGATVTGMQLTVPILVFGVYVCLLFLGTAWNLCQYYSCIRTKCDKLGTEYIELASKLCSEQCWSFGVSGLSSIKISKELVQSLRDTYPMVPLVLSMCDIYETYRKAIKYVKKAETARGYIKQASSFLPQI